MKMALKEIIEVTGLKKHQIRYYNKSVLGKTKYEHKYNTEDLQKLSVIAFLRKRKVPVYQIRLLFQIKNLTKAFKVLTALRFILNKG